MMSVALTQYGEPYPQSFVSKMSPAVLGMIFPDTPVDSISAA
jgi:hypothetical protein